MKCYDRVCYIQGIFYFVMLLRSNYGMVLPEIHLIIESFNICSGDIPVKNVND